MTKSPKFEIGDRVRRSDGQSGEVVGTVFRGLPSDPHMVQVRWDSSGSKSVRPEDGLELIE